MKSSMGYAILTLVMLSGVTYAQPADGTLTKEQIEELVRQANVEYEQGKLKECAATAELVLAARRKLLPEKAFELRESLRWVADCHRYAGQFPLARKHLAEALEVTRLALGDKHWLTHDSQLQLADFDREQRLSPQQYKEVRAAREEVRRGFWVAQNQNLQEGLRITQAAAATIERTVGTTYFDYALAQANIATMSADLGDLASAVPAYQKALDASANVFGEEHPEYCRLLGNFVLLHCKLRDYSRGIELSKQEVELRGKLWGTTHFRYAEALHKLGMLYAEAGDVDQAMTHLVDAERLHARSAGEDNKEYGTILHALASAHQDKGNLAEARRLYERSLAISEKLGGKSNREYLSTLNNLAQVNLRLNDRETATAQMRQVVDSFRHAFGSDHPDLSSHLYNLTAAYMQVKDYASSQPLILETLRLERSHLDRTFSVISEKRQLTLAKHAEATLHRLLTIAEPQKLEPAMIYDHVLAWKGSVYVYQQQARSARETPACKKLLDELQSVTRQLATMVNQPQDVKAQRGWQQQFKSLSEEQQRIEAELAQESAAFSQLKTAAKFTSADLRKLVPADAVLFDFVEYEHSIPISETPDRLWRSQRRLLAFVVERDQPIECVQLGSSLAAADLIAQWRTDILKHRGGVFTDAKARAALPQYELRDQLWTPLAAHAKNAKTLIISPDGVLSLVPWACLPGVDPGKYLVEEFALIAAPVPRQMGAALQAAPVSRPLAPSLCLVGGIDFGASPGAPSDAAVASAAPILRAAQRENTRFTPLPGTAKEVEAIARFYRSKFADGSLAQGVGERATEDRVRKAAARYNHLHFATHGFIADERKPDADTPIDVTATESHPGLLCGIALAGANRGPEDERSDDGILTALEVASLDLSKVELVVLSACETGLGTVVRGEGVLGLQRSFQMAGARNSVTSLWKVDDTATQTMMIEFYRNLWEESLPKPEALRRTQLSMLERYDATRHELRPRGLSLLPDPSAAKPAPARLPPYYWAAFTLSGDFR
jgi:CHAT domain-containing protein